ncbi:MAG: enoyl-CoA hydratase-related protein [Actinomycetota bacterium]
MTDPTATSTSTHPPAPPEQSRPRVRVERRGAVEVVTLDRPDRRNAVDHPMLLELLDLQQRIATDAPTEVRVVVLTGTPPAFCAGADLNGVDAGRFATDLGRVLQGFGSLPVPVIAAVDGPALGAGTQLALACDLRIATTDSVFGIPAAKLGLAVDAWTLRRATSEFGGSVARGMLVAAETSTGGDLHRTGGVHRTGDLADALAWAERLSALAPLTMAAHKLGLESQFAGAPPDAFEAARTAAWDSADAEEGRVAFLEKRRPDFRGV